jgi:hypothetical protein
MSERIETRVLAVLAISLTLFGIFGPYRWHDMPTWITNSALALALFLALWAIFIWVPAPSKGLKKSVAAFLISAGVCALIIGLVAWLDPSLLHDKEPAQNFAYVGTLSQAENPFANHFAIVNNRTGGPLPNVMVSIQKANDVSSIRQVFFPYVPQDGRFFVPIGEAHTMQLGAGDYFVNIEAQDGSFLEFLTLKETDKGLKRDIKIYKKPPLNSGSVTMIPLLVIKDN